MNVSILMQMAYEIKHNWALNENKPNQTQFQTPGNEPNKLKEKEGIRNFFTALVCRKD